VSAEVDLSALAMVAAGVLGVGPEAVLSDLDLDVAARCIDSADSADPLRRSCQLLWWLLRERPLARDNDLIALIFTAQLLDEAGIGITFEPTTALDALVKRVRSGLASPDDVVNFVSEQILIVREQTHMFERFGPDARRAIHEAKQAAQAMQHNFVGTEHLLLGVLSVPDGVAGEILSELGVQADGVSRQVRAIVAPGPRAVVGSWFTPGAKKVLERSLRHALSLGEDHIGIEHVLLALAEAEDRMAGQILAEMGVTFELVQDKVISAARANGVPTPRPLRPLAKYLDLGPGQALRPRMDPPQAFPSTASARLRNRRLLTDLSAVINENGWLRAEVDRLRAVLQQNNIDPEQPASGQQPG
jgi:Clp amino terminal domain, pathogenicity island component